MSDLSTLDTFTACSFGLVGHVSVVPAEVPDSSEPLPGQKYHSNTVAAAAGCLRQRCGLRGGEGWPGSPTRFQVPWSQVLGAGPARGTVARKLSQNSCGRGRVAQKRASKYGRPTPSGDSRSALPLRTVARAHSWRHPRLTRRTLPPGRVPTQAGSLSVMVVRDRTGSRAAGAGPQDHDTWVP